MLEKLPEQTKISNIKSSRRNKYMSSFRIFILISLYMDSKHRHYGCCGLSRQLDSYIINTR